MGTIHGSGRLPRWKACASCVNLRALFIFHAIKPGNAQSDLSELCPSTILYYLMPRRWIGGWLWCLGTASVTEGKYVYCLHGGTGLLFASSAG